MLNIISFSVLALAASSVTGLVVPRSPAAPADWPSSLERYGLYHARYLAIGCYTKHNDPAFFDRCCHPLQSGSKPDPTCAPSSSGVDEETPDNDNDNDDCEDDDTDASLTPTTTATPVMSPTSTPYGDPPAEAKVASSNGAVNINVSADANGDVQAGGFATFYYQGGNAGACGQYHGDYDLIAAMDYRRYGNTSRKSSLCGKRVEITNTKNHKKVVVTIADACPTCKNSNSIDLSVGAFHKIATEEEGMVPISWRFV